MNFILYIFKLWWVLQSPARKLPPYSLWIVKSNKKGWNEGPGKLSGFSPMETQGTEGDRRIKSS